MSGGAVFSTNNQVGRKAAFYFLDVTIEFNGKAGQLDMANPFSENYCDRYWLFAMHIPFDCFKERFDKKISKVYLDGRYGGVPLFDSFFFSQGYQMEDADDDEGDLS